ncbi:ABC transporter substrate-binding protein [Sphingomonas sp. ID0503]|uniref:ABC transporter substrate-binding protein n=1 Tax=Sphingomonas sp. ID0503 TaxID=3399691 RepID=UPI003AFB7D95
MRLHDVGRYIGRAALLFAAGILVASCGGSDKDGQAGAARVRFAFALPTSWDPVTSRTGADINTISLAYASLTRLDKDGNAEPSLAETWSYSPDGKALTFQLRKGLTFTDGTPLDSAAVKAFFDRGLTQADSFLKSDLGGVESVSVDGPLTVTFHLKEPDYQLPYVFAGRVGAIASPAAARKDAKKLALWPVGAGPFRIVEFVPESHAYFEKNPGYWDAANIHIDRLELTNQPDQSTLIAALQSGSIDVAARVAPRRIQEAKDRGLTVLEAPSLNAADVSINRNRPPFDNPKVVEALRYAFDRAEIIKTVAVGHAAPTHQPFPPGHFAFNPEVEKLWNYDPARTKALLKAAGYAPGALSVEIAVNPILNDGVPELVQAQLQRVGIKSKLRIVPPGSSTWQSEVYIAKRPAIAIDGTIGRESPVQNLLATYGPQGIMNLSGPYASPAFLAAIDTVRRTPVDDPAYRARLHEAVRIGVEQSPTNYILSTPWSVIARPRIRNLNVLPSQIRWEGVTVQ